MCHMCDKESDDSLELLSLGPHHQFIFIPKQDKFRVHYFDCEFHDNDHVGYLVFLFDSDNEICIIVESKDLRMYQTLDEDWGIGCKNLQMMLVCLYFIGLEQDL